MEALSRRDLLRRAATGGAALTVGPALLGVAPRASAAVPAPLETHLGFGPDPTSAMTVSWSTSASVTRPRVRYGPATAGDLGATSEADSVAVKDRDPRAPAALQAETVTHHASLNVLEPDTDYVYEILQEGSPPLQGTFRTAPAGRTGFRFTAFGDQGTGDATDVLGAPQGQWIVDQVELRRPLFHLHLGDLVYANLNPPGTRDAAWNRFMANNARSARFRPWMPILGNHEIENGMGELGYDATLARFRLASNWYAFTVGSVRFVAVDTEDWCYQKGGDIFLQGYSGGAQRAWLESELAASRANRDIDWIVLLAHHLTVSSANSNGSDLGLREQMQPLVDRYGVDLVLSGHDHNYERSYALRGTDPGTEFRRPAVVDRSPDDIDTTKGTIYLVLGGGGTKAPTASYDADPVASGEQAPVYHEAASSTPTGREDVTWSAHRDEQNPWGFAEIEVDPGVLPGGETRLTVTQYRTATPTPGAPSPDPVPGDRFTLRRPRSDGY
jgi:3',5'-cyclic AMP phosphodiesterase CpdA